MRRGRHGTPVRARVFINYRSSDAGWAVHLDNALSARFGADRVFRASRSIQPGEDFIDRILSTVEASNVLMAVIGPGWLAATDKDGVRALDNGGDWVRREIAHAFRRRVQVLPLLVDNAPPLEPAGLPDDIAQIARCQYLRINHRAVQTDTQRVGDELVKLIPELAVPAKRRGRLWLFAALAMAVAVLLVAGAVAWSGRSRPDSVAGSVATPRATPSHAKPPWIVARPSQGGPTAPFQVKGDGFAARQRITLSISTGNDWIDIGTITTNEFGEFLADLDTKVRLTAGVHIIATDSNNDPRFHATTKYTVVA
jgi:hypothetical protein